MDSRNGWTRREVIAGSAAGFAALVLAACGSDDGGDDATATSAAGTSTPPGSSTTTIATGVRTVETDRGPLEVPATVQRLVCADYYGAFPAVDVGAVPVGISGGAGDAEPYATALAGAAIVGDYVEPSPEQVAAATPDLILRTIDTDDQMYEQLSAIAPTAVISFQGLALTEVAQRVGELLGHGERAAELVAEYEARGASIHERFAEVIDSTTWATVSPAVDSQWFLLSPAWTDNEAISVAGIRFSDAVVAAGEQGDYSLERSLEQLGELADADVLLVTQALDDDSVDPSMEPITSSAVWASLPAVQRGNVFPAPQGTSSLGMAFTLLDALEAILPQVATS